ncbi:hypothetical protein NHQ30_008304 [Ciborinia camelliae]|nr:hypothetical protein NHQ30_008304 [Ciborinia camelliae]
MSFDDNDDEKEKQKGARGKAKDLMRRGTKKLKNLPKGKDAKGPKEVWKPMKRIKGFQHIE